MDAFTVGFGLGFVVALQLGPISLYLIRSTLRGGLAVGLAIAGGIAVIDLAVGLGSLVWDGILATSTAMVGRAAGPHLLRAVDLVAGIGLISFGCVSRIALSHDPHALPAARRRDGGCHDRPRPQARRNL